MKKKKKKKNEMKAWSKARVREKIQKKKKKKKKKMRKETEESTCEPFKSEDWGDVGTLEMRRGKKSGQVRWGVNIVGHVSGLENGKS